jgi:hypothetical protein
VSVVIENTYCSPKFIDLKRSLFWQTYTSYKRVKGLFICLFFALLSPVFSQNANQASKNQNQIFANSGLSDQNAAILSLNNASGNEGKIYSEGEKFFTRDTFAASGLDKTPTYANTDVFACSNVTSGGYVTTSDGQTIQISCTTSFNPSAFLNNTAASGGSQTLYYQWQSSIDNYTWTDISGATSSTYDPPTLYTLTYFRRLARRYECTTWLASNTLIIAANMLPTMTLSKTDPSCGGSDGTITVTGSGGILGLGTITYQKWNSISGSAVSNLTSSSSYPNSPSSTTTLTQMEADIDQADNFGGRMIGYITPHITGTYYFWISSDDNGELWLSTNSNAANKSRIAYHTSYTGSREWNKFSTQKSAPIDLVAGEIYYIEAIYKEGGGGDNLAVGWAKPGESTASPSEVIPIDAIRPFQTSSVTTPTYQYKLNNGSYQTDNVFTGLAAGTHTVTIKDVYGCTTTSTITLTQSTVGTSNTVSLTGTNPSCAGSDGTITATAGGGTLGSGTITYQKWDNVSGTAVSNLTSISSYPNSPSSTTTLTQMEAAIDQADNFGGRMVGYITPSITGTYYFWISSDDNGELWLSTNSSASNKSRIAYHTSYTTSREWNKFSTQKSAAINLVAGEIYYIEALYKEGGGGDNLAIGWSKPGESTSSPSEVIPAEVIRPFLTSSVTTPTYQYKLNSGSYQNSNVFTGLSAGTYTVTVKDASGCTTSATTTLTANPATNASVTAANNGPICVGETLNLTGTSTPTGVTYQWTGPGGFTSSSQNPTRTNATTGMTGTYTLAVTFGSGCTTTATATTYVSVTAIPGAPGATGATRCGTGTVTLSASGCTGTYRWYNTSTGGTLLGSGSSFTTPSISSTTNYYVECNVSNCTSTRTPVTATVSSGVTPTATGDTECEGSTIILGATGGTTYTWAGPNGFTSSQQNPTRANGTTSMSGIYTVTVTNASGCSATATASVSVNAIPAAATGADVTRCNAGTVSLTATGCTGGTYTWYANTTTSTSLATGAVYTTPSISSTTTYYVSCTLNGCESNTRGSINAIVTAPPSAPVTVGNSRCGTGSVTLSASGCSGTYAWYTAATGGSSIGSGASFTTPSLSSTTNYYVECNYGCVSSRALVTATINANPAAAAIGDNECEGSAIILGASGGTSYNWTGPNSFTSTLQNPTINNGTVGMTGIYTVTVTNAAGCTATATASVLVKPIPDAPNATDVARCGTGTVTLAATGCSGTYTWYANPTTSTSLGTGANYTTPSISSTTVYYVSCILNGCESNTRVAVSAIVTTPPAAPATISGSRCGTGTVALSANGCSGTYAWYTTATGGSSIGSGANFTTPVISGTTTYYVECNYGCLSTRAAVTATINALPSPTTVGDNECEGSTIVLGASGGVSYSWTGPNSFISNVQNPTIPNGTTGMSGIYTVTVTNAAGCTATATASVLVKPIPGAPTGNDNSRCGTGTITLSASGCTGGTYTWYANATTSTALATGSSYTTPSISGTTTYYVSCTVNGCTSTSRGSADAIIKPIPSAPTTSPVSRCGTGSVTLSADNCAGTVTWYANATTSTVSGTGNYTTPSIAAGSSATYYATCTVNGCVSTSRSSLTVTVLVPPTASASNTGAHCMGTTFKLIGGGNGESFSWSGPNGFSSSEQSPLVSSATSAMAGVYTLTVTASNGCTATATTNMVINTSCGSICTTPIAVQPTSPTSCSGTDGYIFVTEYSAGPYYENSMDGITWYNSEKTYSGLGVGYYTIFIRDKTSKIVCRTISAVLTSSTSSYFTGATTTSATSCSASDGKIVLQNVLGTDDVSWISSTSRSYVKVSSLSPANTISNLAQGTYYVIVSRGGNPLCYSERRVTVGNSGAACPTGLCTIAKNTNLFPSGDFGSGSSITGPSLAPGETQYSYAPMNCDSPNDGNYTITNTTDCNGPSTAGGKIFTTWDILTEDHTSGDVNGYMMIVNASYNPDIVIERTVNNLCPNTRYEYSLWIYNICPAADATGCTIKPNLTFLVDGIGKYSTGDITGTGWQQVGFTFTTGNSTTSTFSIRNNATGGQGNDWAIDDIAIIQCLPSITQSGNMTKCIGTTGQTISATVTDGSTQYTYYKWQQSTDGGTTWTDLTSATPTTFVSGAYTVSYTLPTITAAMNGRKYKIVVGTSLNNLANSDCSYGGNVTTLTVPVITVTPSANQTICAGSSTTITASASGGTGPYTYSWNNGLGTGTSKTVSPAATTTYTVTVTDANGCTATATTQVIVNSLPAAPTAVNGSRCGTGTVTLGTTGCSGTVTWYASSTATSSLATGTNYTTPGISATTAYYVTCTVNSCVSSSRTTVTATVNTIPTATATGDIECAGSVINLSATGGSTYSWTGPSGFSSTAQNPTRANATTLMAGVYTVTVTSAEGCTASATASVTVNPAPAPAITGNTTICPEQSTTLTANGGDTYIWSTGETTASINVSPTTATTYSVTAYATNTSYTNLVKDQSIFNAANFSFINSSASYAGPASLFDGIDNTGGDTFHATRITNGQTWGIGYSLGGDYMINALSLDARNDCCTDRAKGGVMQIWKSGSMVYQSAVVNGSGSGIISASPAPNVIGDEIRYVFLNGANTLSNETTLNFSELIIGGAKVCSATTQVTVTVNSKPIPTANSNTPVCVGQTLNLTSSGGTSYSWSGPNSFSSAIQNPTISSVTTAAGGVYTVTVTNANGCSATATTSVVINTLPTPTANSNTPACVGQTLNLTSSGGTSYSWAGPNSFSSATQNPTISNVTTAAAGIYTVTVTNANGCSATATTSVVINTLPTPTANSNTPVCVGQTLNLTSSGGTSYSWSGPNSFTSTSQNPNISSVTTAAAGVYTVTVTNSNGCSATATISVVINALPTPTANSNTPVCVGKTLNLTSSGGTSYSWSGPNSFTSTSQNPNISSVTTAAAGVYTVTVTNANGCSATATTSVVINALPTPTANSNTPVCVGQTLNLTSSGGTSYSWSGPNSFSSAIQNPTISSVTTAAGGVYTVTVTNANGCSATATTSVVINALPTPTANSNTPVCVGQTLNLTSSGGTSYSWSGPNSFSSAIQNPSLSNVTTSAAGIYTVTVTNANGCSATATTSVVINALPTPTANSNTPVCVGQTLNLTSSGGTSYSWAGPNSFSSATQNPTISNVTTAAAGIYTVTVTNANGCSATATTSVVINALPTPTANSNTPVCVGQTLNLTSSGGTSYSWSGPNSFSSAIQNPSLSNVTTSAAGVYTVTVTNANGCSATATTSVVINTLPTPTANSNTPVCVGKTLNLTSSGGTSYSWSGPNSFNSAIQNPSLSNITTSAAGIYTVTVTNANGCSATATTSVVINTLPTPTANSNAPVCVGQTLNLTSSGGTSYSWSGPNSFSSAIQNPNISSVTTAAAGIYTVTVTNANGCSATATTSVVINTLPTPTANSNTPVCVGQTLNLTSSGGTSYSWSGPNSFSSAIQNPSLSNVTTSAAGIYTVTVTNANGCSATATTSVVINALPTPTANSNTPVCVGQTLNLTSSGGTSYSWAGPNSFSSATQNPTISNVTTAAAGIYTVTVTNANGCSATATISVVINALPTPTANSNTPVCVGQTLNLTSSGGTSYSWSGPNSFSSAIQNPNISSVTTAAAGIYTVTVTNVNGCSATATTSVVINTLPTPTASSNSPVCAGQNLNLTSSGGTSYSWSGPNSFTSTNQNPNISNVSSAANGIYTVTVTNTLACSATATINVVIYDLPTPPIVIGASRCGAGSVTLTANGCAGGTIQWYDAQTGGNLLGTGITFATNTITQSTFYFASCFTNNCPSPSRTAGLARINSAPNAELIPVNSTCIANNPQNNGKLLLNRYRNDDQYSYNIGTSYNSAIASAFIAIPSGGLVPASNLPNPTGSSQAYTVRIKNVDGCTIDRTVLLTKQCEGCPQNYCPPATAFKTK